MKFVFKNCMRNFYPLVLYFRFLTTNSFHKYYTNSHHHTPPSPISTPSTTHRDTVIAANNRSASTLGHGVYGGGSQYGGFQSLQVCLCCFVCEKFEFVLCFLCICLEYWCVLVSGHDFYGDRLQIYM